MQAPECPRCRGSMATGLVLDRGHGDSVKQQEWFEGEPVKSFWSGLKLKGREHHVVRTFRCTRCGYLESYASET